MKNELDSKIKLLGDVDDPADPGYGFPYHFPYDASFTPSDDKITIGLKTITLDNNKYKMTFNKELPAATESSIGLMTANDAKAVRTNLPTAINAIKTYRPIKTEWKQSSTPGGLTLEEFCTAINNDPSVKEGDAYCGNINSNNFFEGMRLSAGGQLNSAEVNVQIMGAWQTGHVQLLTVTSSNNAPYFWQYTWVDGLASWVSWTDVRPLNNSYSSNQLNYISIDGNEYMILPKYTSADKGKILMINNGGVPEWTSI